jgi:hypothetical protein
VKDRPLSTLVPSGRVQSLKANLVDSSVSSERLVSGTDFPSFGTEGYSRKT